jgi:hypothetical protein
LNQQHLIDIANAKTRTEAIEALHRTFLGIAAAHGTPQNIAAELQVNGTELSVVWNSVAAKATGRTVRAPDKSFRMEYVFRVPIAEDNAEVGRFYLTDGGRLTEDMEGTRPICDYNNTTYMATHVCTRIVLGMLSRLYEPTPFEG